jgi:hypothetical protein
MFLPWLLKIAPGLTRWNEFVASTKSVHIFLQEIIETHKLTYDSSTMRDFIDAYFKEINQTKDPDSSFYQEQGGIFSKLHFKWATLTHGFVLTKLLKN